ncbi:leucine-rich repeat extensin-like protein 5 [Xenopus tropicalis]|uniref:Leucine-rich repeat extensin-like protein 5 n=1 Tax=Xenopus tropicalis TaxID=8364 RepID=A0A8J1J7W4_XENTR|nr:leucine-rich repeat extensin-like protein 5 [Xenopus tropicalis]
MSVPLECASEESDAAAAVPPQYSPAIPRTLLRIYYLRQYCPDNARTPSTSSSPYPPVLRSPVPPSTPSSPYPQYSSQSPRTPHVTPTAPYRTSGNSPSSPHVNSPQRPNVIPAPSKKVRPRCSPAVGTSLRRSPLSQPPLVTLISAVSFPSSTRPPVPVLSTARTPSTPSSPYPQSPAAPYPILPAVRNPSYSQQPRTPSTPATPLYPQYLQQPPYPRAPRLPPAATARMELWEFVRVSGQPDASLENCLDYYKYKQEYVL